MVLGHSWTSWLVAIFDYPHTLDFTAVALRGRMRVWGKYDERSGRHGLRIPYHAFTRARLLAYSETLTTSSTSPRQSRHPH